MSRYVVLAMTVTGVGIVVWAFVDLWVFHNA